MNSVALVCRFALFRFVQRESTLFTPSRNREIRGNVDRLLRKRTQLVPPEFDKTVKLCIQGAPRGKKPVIK